ncbi:hypothetical protein D3879_25565 [Pseudomonas cavernicola]|uniref:Uncharacterized protein n=1 Tax=Pseudomonas cavernicola TaxID=2320866 RepID=A0A418X9M0_9PSED|nr:hypothetical protein D3879_25565 [Pseudomonas cavernicola]
MRLTWCNRRLQPLGSGTCKGSSWRDRGARCTLCTANEVLGIAWQRKQPRLVYGLAAAQGYRQA